MLEEAGHELCSGETRPVLRRRRAAPTLHVVPAREGDAGPPRPARRRGTRRRRPSRWFAARRRLRRWLFLAHRRCVPLARGAGLGRARSFGLQVRARCGAAGEPAMRASAAGCFESAVLRAGCGGAAGSRLSCERAWAFVRGTREGVERFGDLVSMPCSRFASSKDTWAVAPRFSACLLVSY